MAERMTDLQLAMVPMLACLDLKVLSVEQKAQLYYRVHNLIECAETLPTRKNPTPDRPSHSQPAE